MTLTRPSVTTHLRHKGIQRGRSRRDEAHPARSVLARTVIPRSLVVAAGWSWRLLLVGFAAYALVRVLALLALVVIPVVAAVLLAALLRPATELLQRRLPGPLSALLTLLLAVVVMGGLGYLISVIFAQQLPSLIQQLVATIHQIRAELAGRGVDQLQLDQIEATVVDWLQRNRSEAVGYLTTGAGYFIEFVTLTVLTLFVCFFLLYDGERVWRWVISPLPPQGWRRVDRAGQAAWATIVGRYVRLHPLAIGLAFAVGTVLAGIVGAIIAVPTAVIIHQAWPALRGPLPRTGNGATEFLR